MTYNQVATAILNQLPGQLVSTNIRTIGVKLFLIYQSGHEGFLLRDFAIYSMTHHTDGNQTQGSKPAVD